MRRCTGILSYVACTIPLAQLQSMAPFPSPRAMITSASPASDPLTQVRALLLRVMQYDGLCRDDCVQIQSTVYDFSRTQ